MLSRRMMRSMWQPLFCPAPQHRDKNSPDPPAQEAPQTRETMTLRARALEIRVGGASVPGSLRCRPPHREEANSEGVQLEDGGSTGSQAKQLITSHRAVPQPVRVSTRSWRCAAAQPGGAGGSELRGLARSRDGWTQRSSCSFGKNLRKCKLSATLKARMPPV